MMIGLLTTRSLIRASITLRLMWLRRRWTSLFVEAALLRRKVQAEADLSTFGNCRLYFDHAACSMCSLLHTDEPERRGAWRAFSQALRIETHAVVLYRQEQNISVFDKLQ